MENGINEAALIGCVLADPKLTAKLDIAPEDLANEHAQAILRAALQTEGDAVKIVNAAGKEHVKYATHVFSLPFREELLEDYVRAIKEEIQIRKAFGIAGEIQSAALQGDMQRIRDGAKELEDAIRNKDSQGEYGIRRLMAQFLDEQSRPVNYIRTGFSKLDRNMYISPGDYIVIGGRPSAGKTAFSLALAANMAKERKVVYFSLETKASKIMERLIASQYSIQFEKIKRHQLTDEDRENIAKRYNDMANLNITVVEAAGYDVRRIETKAQKLEAEIVFVDYLGLIQTEGASRYEKVTNISVGLHTFAQHTGITVIALSQLNREGASGREPVLEDLRESGQIEQDADAVLLLDYVGNKAQPNTREYRVVIAKNKEGKTGKADFQFYGEVQRFYGEDRR